MKFITAFLNAIIARFKRPVFNSADFIGTDYVGVAYAREVWNKISKGKEK